MAFCQKNHLEYLLDEWDYEANAPLKPETIYTKSRKKVWWRCPKGHKWRGLVESRTKYHKSCPICKKGNLAQHTEISSLSNGKKEKTKRRYSRERKSDDPTQFEFLRAYCIRTGNEFVLAEWDAEKNLPMTPDNTSRTSIREVHWKCAKGHEWITSPASRIYNKSSCPYCAGHRTIPGETDLATLCPEVAALWHPTKNGDLRPDMIKPGSSYNVWWLCEQGHEWQQIVASLVRVETKCSYCSGRYVEEEVNDLTSFCPEIAAKWHPKKNGKKTSKDVGWNADLYAWWIDEDGRAFREKICEMTKGHKS